MTPSRTFLNVGLARPENVTADNLAELYREWTNNYLSVALFAEDYGITTKQAELIIDVGRKINNLHASWLKEHQTFANKDL